MADQPVITVEGVSKAYRIWNTPAQRLISPLTGKAADLLPGGLGEGLRRAARSGYRDFYALENIDFEVRRGEAVGIVGRNGAGKSTLLQIIAGTLQPTAGRVAVNGRIAALLELGAGFNPEFTGRENVLLSCAILGLSRAEADARFDAIAAFADIGDFVEQPVKTYSSGMMMRLAFAVNTCVDPEVLIVDEALSVGDAPFQAKCFRRLRQLIDQGVSLLFVSHDLGTVRSICSRALWLRGGRAERWGEAKDVAKEYEKFCWQEQGVVLDEPEAPDASRPVPTGTPMASVKTVGATAPDRVDGLRPAMTAEPPTLLFTSKPAPREGNQMDRYGTGAVTIDNLLCTNDQGEPVTQAGFNDRITLHYVLTVHQPIDSDIVVGIRVKDTKENYVFSTQDIHQQHRLTAPAGTRFYARTSFHLPLTHDTYLIKTGIFGFSEGESRPGGRYDFSQSILWDIIEEACTIKISVNPSMPLVGPVHAHSDLLVTPLRGTPS